MSNNNIQQTANLHRSAAKVRILLATIFVLGAFLGRALWPRIALPFHNPWEVVGPLTLIEFNPANNLLAFVLFVLLPIALLLGAYLTNLCNIRASMVPPSSSVDSSYLRDGYAPPWSLKWMAVILLLVFSLVAGLNTRTHHAWGSLDTFHEGEGLGAAVSYDQGREPYRDFLFCHGLFQDPARCSVAFELFGRSIGAARAVESALKILLFILVAVFAIALYPGRILASLLFVGAVVVASSSHWFLPERVVSHLPHPTPLLRMVPRDTCTLAFLLVMLFLARRATSEKASPPSVIALAAVLFSFIPLATFAYSVDRGFYLCAVLLLLSPLLYLILPNTKTLRLGYLAGLLAGLAAGILTLKVLLGAGFMSFVEYTFITMPRCKELIDGARYPIWHPVHFAACLAIALNAYWLCVRWLRELRNDRANIGRSLVAMLRRYPEEVCLLLLSVFFFRSALSRSDWGHLVYSLLPTYLLAMHIGLKHYLLPALSRRGRVEKLLTVSSVVIMACVCISGAWRIQDDDLLTKNFPIGTLDEAFIPADHQATTDLINRTLDERHTNFITMTNEAIWYYYINRACPTRFPVVWFAAPRFYQEEMVRDIERRDVGVVLWKSSQGWDRMDGIANERRLPIVADYLKRRYAPFAAVGGNELWIRKDMLPPRTMEREPTTP